MKGLLQSKRFKKNLSKWLCMYVGVLLLLTTVITYSKYISSFMGNDEARAAKFKVKINTNDCILNATGESCDSGTYFRDDEITYKFVVDTTELEATADFVLTVAVDSKFSIIKIANGSNTVCENDNCKANIVNGQKVISLLTDASKQITAGHGTSEEYTVIVKYSGTDEDFKDNLQYKAKENYQIVNLNYSAIQKN